MRVSALALINFKYLIVWQKKTYEKTFDKKYYFIEWVDQLN